MEFTDWCQKKDIMSLLWFLGSKWEQYSQISLFQQKMDQGESSKLESYLKGPEL